ncbi:acetyl/propionyl/methylcrotonyl-CoA carboxylase subunit alpha [Candidatus Berkiella aquae]|uniref:Biotin carboxylase n=1 Tax=Candidatus Berkiella aquae TaxID=295108 RepID=A0A0Q9YXD9_9GAMM|nr:biotin carboxylase N-terminal domain-containing protein [Candidatus Berkiella aquae]MCS5712397.1 ATP-grasp domain-containing protein [Candidatus Berkiella aquae]
MGKNTLKSINRLLIANRGEIACRIIRTAKKLGIHTIAVYALEDQHALHCSLADEALCIGGGALEKSYLNIDHIIQAARQSDADAIHPGYGFLSENAAFAKRCATENIIFIGPTDFSIAQMAVKDQAKKIMRKANVPVIPGYEGDEQSISALQQAATKIGYPIMLKAAKGGGGKGMRIVKQPDELAEAIQSAKRESLHSFGDETLFIEKYVPHARHIEVQIFRDQQGNAVHLFERDCSLQRRHQKIIEESPALGLTDAVKQALYQAALNAAHAINYLGAGTVEFLYAPNGEFYFMEMNTRLQVEHPVTEMITGLDLVEWQIRIAQGHPIPLAQSEIKVYGHALEARIYAEDPTLGFLPATGHIKAIFIPNNTTGYRLDSGLQVGDTVGIHFDPLLAKLIVHANSRAEAVNALYDALSQYNLIGITTNIAFLRSVLRNDNFIQGHIDTQTLERSLASFLPKPQSITIEQLAIASILVILMRQYPISSEDLFSPWNVSHAWRLNEDFKETIALMFHQEIFNLTITHLPAKRNALTIRIVHHGQSCIITGKFQGNLLHIQLPNEQYAIPYFYTEDLLAFIAKGNTCLFKIANNNHDHDTLSHATPNTIRAPMPGVVTKIWVKSGDKVTHGEKLMALEAMKMEHTLAAAKAGAIKAIRYSIGDQVEEGCELIDFE